MRVLCINDYESLGGAEVVVHLEVAGLRERGHEVRLLTADNCGLGRGPLSYVDSRSARRVLGRSLEEFKPDVVHLHNFYHLWSPGILSVLEAWKAPGRVVMTTHDYHLVCPNPSLRCFKKGGLIAVEPAALKSLAWTVRQRWDGQGMARSCARLIQHVWNYRILDRRRAIDTIICPSEVMARAIEAVGLRACRLSYPLETSLLREAARAGAGQTTRSGEAFVIVFAGRVEPEKGLEGFISSIAGLAGVRLIVLGDGSRLGACRELAERVGVDAQFRGRVDRQAVARELSQAHALVLPSLWAENAPMAMFEALAAGTPVMVSNVGGMREIVDTFGVGWLFDPSDARSIRECVERAKAEGDFAPESWARVREELAQRSPVCHAGELERIYAGQA